MRADLPQIIVVVAKQCPRARIVISTNGFATELIIRQMKEILAIKPDIGIAVSIDGVGEMHNEMRGIAGGFAKAIATIKELKLLGIKNLRLGFTVTEKNIKHLQKVYDLSRELGAQFTHSFAQSSEFYFGGKQNADFKQIGEESLAEGMALGTEDEHRLNNPLRVALKEQYNYLIRQELKGFNLKRWARAYYAHGMFNFITSHNPILSNAPGRDFFFMDPNGIIYPSVVHNFRMGDIKEVGDFAQFWCSPLMDETRKKIDESKVPVWMICTARTAIKKHPLQVIGWILKSKAFGSKLA